MDSSGPHRSPCGNLLSSRLYLQRDSLLRSSFEQSSSWVDEPLAYRHQFATCSGRGTWLVLWLEKLKVQRMLAQVVRARSLSQLAHHMQAPLVLPSRPKYSPFHNTARGCAQCSMTLYHEPGPSSVSISMLPLLADTTCHRLNPSSPLPISLPS